MCHECSHNMWDHELIDEGYDWLLFGRCTECDCEKFEEEG